MLRTGAIFLAAFLVFFLFIAGCKTGNKGKFSATPGSTPNVCWDEVRFSRDTNLVDSTVESRSEALARFALGFSQEVSNDLTNALKNYIKASLNDPGNEQLILDVTRVLILKRDFQNALQILQKSAKTTNVSAQILIRLGWVQGQVGQTNEAISTLKKAMSIDPFAIGSYQNLAAIYINSKNKTAAADIILKALNLKTTNVNLWIDAASLASEAIKEVPELKQKLLPPLNNLLKEINIPETPQQLIRLADIYEKSGQVEKAINQYKKILELKPETTEMRLAIREKLMNLYLRSNDRKNAILQLKAIISEKPTNPSAYYYLGSIYFEEKDYEKAAEFLQRTLILNPDFEPAYYDIAAALINANKPDDALRILNRARDRFQKPKFLLEFYSALAYSRKKDYKQALKSMIEAEVIAKATETNRLTAAFYFQMGATFERNKDYKQAEKYFDLCLQKDPNFPEALNYLGYMWADLNVNLDKAKKLIKKALKFEPDNAAYLDSLGWVYYRMKKYDVALRYVEKAVKLSKEPDPTTYDHLGDIYAKLKNWTKAVEYWKKSFELENNEEVKKKIDSAPSM